MADHYFDIVCRERGGIGYGQGGKEFAQLEQVALQGSARYLWVLRRVTTFDLRHFSGIC